MTWRDRFQALLGLSHLGKKMSREGFFSKSRWALLEEVTGKLFGARRERPARSRFRSKR